MMLYFIFDFTVRCESLVAQNEASSGKNQEKELEELKLQYKQLKVYHVSSFFWLI